MASLRIPEFKFEDGTVLTDVDIRYDSWGTLNARGDNAVLVGHALTASTVVTDWWGAMLGDGRCLDPSKDFVICASLIGSPYGDLSPLTTNPSTGRRYGSAFPAATVRDTVRLHRILLDQLGVTSVQFAIGSSLGAMQALEWMFEDDFVKGVVAIAVGGRHSPWSIGWSDSQRHCIYADAKWNGGDYDLDDPPKAGLAAARMVAMLSYRSAYAYEQRFGREKNEAGDFQVESYLRYQGKKLVDRFDASCYVALTKLMNSYDLSKGRGEYPGILAEIKQPALIVGIESDILYPINEQKLLADHLPNATFDVVVSPHGHDAFLIELESLNRRVLGWRAAEIDGLRQREEVEK